MASVALKERLKNLAARAMRPGLLPVHERLDRFERRLAASGAAVWRGGADGFAVRADGARDAELTAKYREELGYWIRAAEHGDPGFTEGGDLHRTFAHWQSIRLRELGEALGLSGESELHEWCAQRRAVEIGSGPHPAVSAAKWRTCIAVDPLAEGYLRCGLTPPGASDVVWVTSGAERVPLPGAGADIVICENCLDHVEDPRAVMGEMARLLAPGGVLWLLVDQMEHADRMHPHPMNERRLSDLAQSCGLLLTFSEVKPTHSHPRATGQIRCLYRLGREPGVGASEHARQVAAGAQ